MRSDRKKDSARYLLVFPAYLSSRRIIERFRVCPLLPDDLFETSTAIQPRHYRPKKFLSRKMNLKQISEKERMDDHHLSMLLTVHGRR